MFPKADIRHTPELSSIHHLTLQEFGGRAKFLVNYAGGGDIDVHGHGTHVAGTVGSETFGVAKKTKLFGVKVLNNRGNGTYAGIISGLDFVARDAQSRYCPKGAMANMSLGGGRSEALNEASAALVNSGVFLAVAAGNSNMNAASYSPASEPLVCTIGATDSNDARAYYSNYGEVVDLFAPGSDVLSTLPGNSSVSYTKPTRSSRCTGIIIYAYT